MRMVLVLLVAMMAGCVEDAAPADDAAALPAHEPVVRNATFSVVASGDTSCYATFCFAGGPERLPVPVALHERITSAVLDVQPREGAPWSRGAAVTVELHCGDDWEGCPASPLATTQGMAPLALEVEQRGPWGGDLQVVVRMDAEAVDLTSDQYLEVRMVLFLEDDPERRRMLEERTMPIDHNGVAGACVFVVEPSCTGIPSAWYELGAYSEGTRRIDATVAWDALTPVSEELEVSLRCLREGSTRRSCEERPPLTWTGTSPLRIEADLSDFPLGAALQLSVSTPFPDTRQEFHVGGELVYLGDATARAPGGRDP